MYRHILLGFDGSPQSEDALRLAADLAGAFGSRITVACAYPYEHSPSRASSPEFERVLRDDAHSVLDRARAALPPSLEADFRAIGDYSPARAIQWLAEEQDAGLIVIGSTHAGRIGRILPGTVGAQILHGSPAAVAVAPRGYAGGLSGDTGPIGVAYDGSSSSKLALRAAEAAAAALEQPLRLIGVVGILVPAWPGGVSPLGYAEHLEGLRADVRDDLEKAQASVGVPVEPVQLRDGDPASEILAASEEVRLLVTGSRGFGPAQRILLGSVSTKLVTGAACPVIIVPGGGDVPHAEEHVRDQATAGG